MRAMAFAARTRKEVARDPVTLLFGIGFPLVLLLLMSMLQKSIQADIFRAETFAPGMAVFSLSFASLFGGMLIARDRSSSFLMRLFSSPLTASDYIMGYTLPLLPLSIAQSALCFIAAFFLGLPVTVNVLLVVVVLIPIALLFTGFGLLLGTLCTEKQVAPLGSILVNVATLLGGTWFDLDMVGGTFRTVGYVLPFAHAVDATRAALAGDVAALLPHLGWVIGYTVALFAVAGFAFSRRMRSGSV